MPRILIDESRFQTDEYSDFGGKEIPNNIRVDLRRPSKIHKLKVDYQYFSGAEQWEADVEKCIQSLKSEINVYCTEKFQEAMNTPYSYYGFTYKACWKDLYVSMGYSIDKGYSVHYEIRNAEKDNTKIFDATNKDSIIKKMGEVFDSLFLQKHSFELETFEATTIEELNIIKDNLIYTI